MRLRIHHRLFAGFLGVVGLLVALIVFLVGAGLRRELTRTFEQELRRHLELGAWLAAESPGAGADSLARAMTARVGYRVSFISARGEVMGDSYVARELLEDVENHADRPEVQGALAGRVTFSQRTSETIGDPLLYGARRITLSGEPVVLRIAASLTEVERTVRRVQRTVALTGVVAMLLSLVVAYIISVALTRPLVALSAQARRLATGDFQARAPMQSGVPEWDDLALAFNRLADELRTRLSELGRERDEMQALIDCMAEGVIALSDDARLLRTNRAAREILKIATPPSYAPIGALVRAPELREALEASVVGPVSAREVRLGDRHILVASRTLDTGGAVTTLLDVTEIRRMEQVRRDFVANASHELKTPLTSIHGFVETLLEDDPPEALRQQFLTSIRGNTFRLQRLVDDLLDLSRLESGGWMARTGPLLLAEIAQEAWEPYASEAAGKDVEFSMDADVRAHADPQGLRHVFKNLFENALRHTDEGGHIHVTAALREDGRVTVEVSDDGEGIPSRALPRIFERFYRADSSRDRDAGGTGLGLSIVRHLVSAMGGEVEAQSELGRGTTIRFTIPADL